MIKTENAVIFSEAEKIPEDLVYRIEGRLRSANADGLVLGQEPLLNLGFIDPVTGKCVTPNSEAFAVTKECYESIGEIDKSLGSASAADYLFRMQVFGKKVELATDIRLPVSTEKSITDFWVDGVLLGYKYANKEERKNLIRSIICKLARYDRTIGNYSRKDLLGQVKRVLSVKRGYKRSEDEVISNFFELSTARGQHMMSHGFIEEEPLVSLILRTHERPEVLRLTLNNLRRLDYRNFEIVLIEDGKALSQEMAEKEFADLNIRYYSTGEPVGRAAAANIGFRMAEGEWVNLIDDDDFFFPEHLNVGITYALNEKVDMVFLQSVALETDFVYEPYGLDIKKMHHMDFPHIDVFSMVTECKTSDNGVLFRKELLNQCGYMREDLGAHEDWNLWLRLMRKAHWVSVPYATCIFVNPVQDEDKIKRAKAYKEYDGKQFDDSLLVYETTGEQVRTYFLNTVNDLCALEEEGSLSNALAEIKERYPYDEKILENAFSDWTGMIRTGEGGVFTAKEFNIWYCGLVDAIFRTDAKNRKSTLNEWKALSV
ncbi:MAG: glycosyltransferase [Oscillospiraceae bacterium]|nr:glycosyltransferase [Oscillospiraceae bacterium]